MQQHQQQHQHGMGYEEGLGFEPQPGMDASMFMPPAQRRLVGLTAYS
jgi:hypothetical protein